MATCNTPSPFGDGRFCGPAATLLANQSSADFAVVMSTGIVGVALQMLGLFTAAWCLFWINLTLFVVLVVLYLLRLCVFPQRVAEDFASHANGPGFLTFVAGTCILGNQFALLAHWISGALTLFWIGALSWVCILWGVLYHIFTAPNKPPLEQGINGAWLVMTVSTQAVVILGSILAKPAGWNIDVAFFILAALFMLGFMLYIFVITMIFYRFCFKPLTAADLSPTFWINAGAVAVTTLAGSELLLRAKDSPVFMLFAPFIRGLTLMAWATSSFWIVMMALLFWWRHIKEQYPFSYTPAYWGMVFPLGMYTACTLAMSKVFMVPWLVNIPELTIYAACAAWLLTFAGMIWSRGKMLLQ